jgi:hypothetical protein
MTNGTAPVRLRLIYTANFQKTEVTLLDEALTENHLDLRNNDCILLVSMSHKIIKFVFGVKELGEMIGGNGKHYADRLTKVCESKTYRITQGGTFNPLMLQNYANALGFELAHIKRFEEHYKREMETARTERLAAA